MYLIKKKINAIPIILFLHTNYLIMDKCILILILLLNFGCTPVEKNHAENLALTKCEMIEIMMKEASINPRAQELYDAKKKTYDSLYNYYKSIYTDSAAWEEFEHEVSTIEKNCPSNFISNTTKKPN